MDKIKASTLADLAYYSRFKPPSRLVTFAAPSSTLTNFPALVKCNSTFHIGTSTGYDVHFQDMSGNELAYDLDYYDPVTGNGAWWVQIPTLASSGPTTIKMVYGDPSASTNGSTPAVVWSDYTYVYHFSNINDLTSRVGSYTITDVSTGGITATVSMAATGITGIGRRIYLTTGYSSDAYRLQVAPSAFQTDTGTISIWGYTQNPWTVGRFITLSTGWRDFRWNVGQSNFTTRTGHATAVTVTMASTNGFYMYGGSTNPTSLGWSVNGIIQDTTGGTTGYMRWDVPQITATGYASSPTDMILDELRISTTSYKSSEWLQYEQLQAKDHLTYTTYGSEV